MNTPKHRKAFYRVEAGLDRHGSNIVCATCTDDAWLDDRTEEHIDHTAPVQTNATEETNRSYSCDFCDIEIDEDTATRHMAETLHSITMSVTFRMEPLIGITNAKAEG